MDMSPALALGPEPPGPLAPCPGPAPPDRGWGPGPGPKAWGHGPEAVARAPAGSYDEV